MKIQNLVESMYRHVHDFNRALNYFTGNHFLKAIALPGF